MTSEVLINERKLTNDQKIIIKIEVYFAHLNHVAPNSEYLAAMEKLLASADDLYVKLKKAEEIYNKYLKDIAKLAENIEETIETHEKKSLVQHITLVHGLIYSGKSYSEKRKKDEISKEDITLYKYLKDIAGLAKNIEEIETPEKMSLLRHITLHGLIYFHEKRTEEMLKEYLKGYTILNEDETLSVFAIKHGKEILQKPVLY